MVSDPVGVGAERDDASAAARASGRAWRGASCPRTSRWRRATACPRAATLADWPIGYDDLAPYYDRVEWEIGVSGASSGPLTDRFARSRGYPMPPLRDDPIRVAFGAAARPPRVGLGAGPVRDQQRPARRPRGVRALLAVPRPRVAGQRQERHAQHGDPARGGDRQLRPAGARAGRGDRAPTGARVAPDRRRRRARRVRCDARRRRARARSRRRGCCSSPASATTSSAPTCTTTRSRCSTAPRTSRSSTSRVPATRSRRWTSCTATARPGAAACCSTRRRCCRWSPRRIAGPLGHPSWGAGHKAWMRDGLPPHRRAAWGSARRSRRRARGSRSTPTSRDVHGMPVARLHGACTPPRPRCATTWRASRHVARRDRHRDAGWSSAPAAGRRRRRALRGHVPDGRGPGDLACAPDGRLHGAENVYVADASLLNTNGGVNPCVTTMANAWRVADALIASAGSTT